MTRARRVLFLFVDGVGIGPDDRDTNPLAAADLPALTELLGGRRPVAQPASRSDPVTHHAADTDRSAPRGRAFLSLDACLGVPGLPQSGTGQSALLTGVNAPALLGRHDGPYPAAPLKPLLAEASLWHRLTTAGRRVALANAYPDRYLDRARLGTGRMGAVARSALLAGVRLRGPDDLRRKRAVSAFLTNSGWREHLGYGDMPDVGEADAGRALARLAGEHDFTLFEHYAADLAGHRPDRWRPREVLEALDRFLGGVLAAWPAEDVLVLASDHGNVEDGTTGRHTLNPALGAWRGPAPARLPLALTDVAPAVLEVLGVGDPAAHASSE